MHRIRRAPRLPTSTRSLSTRATKVLSALDIPTETGKVIPGVYDGAWGGSGEPIESRCPSTGELLATVSTVSMSATMFKLLAKD